MKCDLDLMRDLLLAQRVALLVVSGMFLFTFAQAAEVHTVSWLIWHKKEARTTAVRCNDNPGMAMSDPECINVFTAERKVGALASMRVFESSLRKTQDGRDMMGKNGIDPVSWTP